jgi:hypothetical protein
MNKFCGRDSNYMQVSRELLALAEDKKILTQGKLGQCWVASPYKTANISFTGLSRTFSRRTTFPHSPTSPNNVIYADETTFTKHDSGVGRTNGPRLPSEEQMLAAQRARVAIEHGLVGGSPTTSSGPISKCP